MSPRKKNILIVKAWPHLKKDKLYKGIIRKAENETQYVDIEIENLDPTQLGRIHEINLPLPVRPSKYHRTCAFLMACGIDATIHGASIDLDETVGVTVEMRFGAVAQDGSQQIDFERVENQSKAQADTQGSESTGEQLIDNTFRNEADGEREF